jgi:Xaa-Pro aminopeptidase
MTHAETIYINTNEHYRAVETETREARFVKWWKEKYPAHTVAKATHFTTHSFGKRKRRIRSYTTSTITEKGFRRVLSSKPNVMEYEIEAEFIHEFMRNRSKGFAYTPIIGSGNNANVLHYIENNQQCKSGDLILIDAGRVRKLLQ